jgi:hypothetical protein
MSSTELRADDGTGLIEQLLQLSADIGVEGTVLFGEFLLVYVLLGAVATALLGLHAPYPLFSLQADPVLLIDGTLIGIFTVQAAGSLLLYHFYIGVDNRSVSSVVLSLIALGIGGGLLQLTLPEVWELLVSSILVLSVA